MLPLSVHIRNNPNMSLITDKHTSSLPFSSDQQQFYSQYKSQFNKTDTLNEVDICSQCFAKTRPPLPHPPHTCLMPPQLRAHQFILQSNLQNTNTTNENHHLYISNLQQRNVLKIRISSIILQVDKTTIHHNPVQHLSSNYYINYIYYTLYIIKETYTYAVGIYFARAD